ncbi:MAG: hypothetical protein H0T88_12060 [Lysobacter sp.]|nr:hypothetical protein [Lysobacter sp.]
MFGPLCSISNPLALADFPLEATTLFAIGRHSSVYGVGLGMVQRLCQHSGIGRDIKSAQRKNDCTHDYTGRFYIDFTGVRLYAPGISPVIATALD